MLQTKYRAIAVRLGLSVCAAFFLSVAVSFNATTAQEVGDVAWRFQAGDRFEFSALDQIKTIAIQSGQSFEIPQERTVEAAWVVKSVDAQGAATIEMTLRRVKLQIRSPFAGQIILDSEQIDAGAAEEIQTVQEMYQQFVGQKLLFVMDKQGTIEDLNWAEPLPKSLTIHPMTAAPFSLPEFASILSASGRLPNETKAPGDSWEFETSKPTTSGKLVFSTTMTRGPENPDDPQLIAITMKSAIAFEPDTTTQDATFAVKESQVGGNLEFDGQQGFVKSVSASQRFTIVVEKDGQTAEQKVSRATSFTLTKPNASAGEESP